MIGVIAKLVAADGKGAELEKAFGELSAKVRAGEPGCLMYQLTKSRTEPGVYKVLELYKDEDALNAHRASEHFKAAGPSLGAVLAGRPDVEYLDGL